MSDEFLQMFEPAGAAMPAALVKTAKLKETLQARLPGVKSWDDFLSEIGNWSVGYNETAARPEISVATAGEDGTTKVQFLSDLDARMSISNIDRNIERNNEDKAKVVRFKDWLQKKKNEELEVIFSERNPGFVKPRTEKEATGFLKFIDDWNNRPPRIRQIEDAIKLILDSIMIGAMKMIVSAGTTSIDLNRQGWGYGGDSR